MNQIYIIGNSGSKPTVRYTQSGTAILSVGLAVSKSWKDESGNWQKQTFWINAVTFGKRAEAIAPQIDKGSKIFVQGELSIREYQAKDGTKKTVTEIQAKEIQVIQRENREEPSKWAPQLTPAFNQGMTEDDIPF